MTVTMLPPIDPLAEAIAAVEGLPEVEDAPDPLMAEPGAIKLKDLLIIDYSGDLEKVWAALILASTGAAMGTALLPSGSWALILTTLVKLPVKVSRIR